MINLRILLLEDDLELLKNLTSILKREVKEVYPFSNSSLAFDEIPKIMPDLIISDIVMDNMSGLEMYKKLKKNGIIIPIILASAFSETKYFVEAVKLRVNHFLVKPIDIDELLSELKKLEHKLELKASSKRNEELLVVQSRMAEMGTMIENIAHQWKQPLNTISLCTTTMEIEEAYNQEFIDNIKESITYMNNTINDFHNYFEPNKIKKCFYLSDTLKKVEKLVSAQIKSKKINIIVNQQENITLCSFENELIQVLINLYKNAIDELSEKNYDKFIFIDLSKIDDFIIIKIKDNAGGIKTDNKDTIFEQYFTTKGEKGSGIGLYMSKLIVENNLNGNISVENIDYVYNDLSFSGACFNIKIKKEILEE